MLPMFDLFLAHDGTNKACNAPKKRVAPVKGDKLHQRPNRIDAAKKTATVPMHKPG